MSMGRLGIATVLACGATVLVGAGAQGPASLDVGALLAGQLGLSAAQIETVRRGQPVVVAVPPRVDREIAVAGAVRIAAPASRLVAIVRDIERFERGDGFLATRKFSSPPVLADVASMRLPDQDVRALRSCRPGRCDVKLGQGAFDELKRIDWQAADAAEQANQLARRMAIAYVEQYRAGGNRALAVYRDTPKPIDIASEFADMVRRSSGLTSTLPEVSAYLLAYPQGRPAAVDDFFYWSLAEFGLKPVIRLNHVVVHPTNRPSGLQYVITTKQLYASHYFHTALEVRALLDDPDRPGQGHYLVVLNLARSDGLTGMFGGVIKSKARSGARNGLVTALAAMKRLAEAR
jgi:hypothetical protein